MSLSKRIEEARKAFERGDKQASAHAHTANAISAAREEHGGAGSQYLGEMVYGGLDGIITTFAVVSGVAGAQLGTPVILILGLANLLADGFSMATGAYLSSKSEHEYYRKEWEREAWEVKHFPDGERAELQEVYVRRGYTDEEARQLVEIQSRNAERWVKAMMIDELGMMEDESTPLSPSWRLWRFSSAPIACEERRPPERRSPDRTAARSPASTRDRAAASPCWWSEARPDSSTCCGRS